MIQVICDSCGKEIRRAARGANYVTLLGYDLCMPCRDGLIHQAGKETQRKEGYQLKTYETVYRDTLRRMCK
jgi:hypothetical protein